MNVSLTPYFVHAASEGADATTDAQAYLSEYLLLYLFDQNLIK